MRLTMRKLLAVPCLFFVLLIGACSSTGGQASDDARKALLVAEYSFQAAVKFATAEVQAGRLKGAQRENVDKAITAAKAALDQARILVRAGDASAGSIVAAAANAVAAVLTALQPTSTATTFPDFAEGQ